MSTGTGSQAGSSHQTKALRRSFAERAKHRKPNGGRDDVRSFDIGPLDPTSTLPLYQQLHDRLRDKLLDGWPIERPIPSERQLMQLTGLSRMTVRQAITHLVHEGMLRRDHGRGTFVGDPRATRLLTGYSALKDTVQRGGGTADTTVLHQTTIRASAATATLLQIEAGESVAQLVRLRLIDGLPAMVDYTIIPLRYCPDIVSADVTRSLYDVLADSGIAVERCIDAIEAVAACGEVAEWLDVVEATPLLLLRRLGKTIDDIPVELTDQYVRPDRCLYRVENPAGYAGIDLVGRRFVRSDEEIIPD